MIRAASVVLCATDQPDEPEPPTLRRTGPFLYLRLRRHDYTPDEIAAWAARLAPFLDAGDDAYVFFRHDEAGRGPELALELHGRKRGSGGGRLAPRVLGRTEGHEKHQPFRDVVEPVDHVGGHEDQRTRPERRDPRPRP